MGYIGTHTGPSDMENITISMPPILGYVLKYLNMPLDVELTNLFINHLIDLSVTIVKGKSLSIADIANIAKLYQIDYGNQELFKFLVDNISSVISELSTEIIVKNVEHHDLVIITCLNEKIFIRKGMDMKIYT